MSAGITIAGGGTTAVSTPEMQRASAELHATVDALAGITARVAALRAERMAVGPLLALDEALAHLTNARSAAADTAAGLAAAALRYGAVEDAARIGLRDAGALAFGEAGIVVGDLETRLPGRPARGVESHAVDLLAAIVPKDEPEGLTPAQAARQRRWDRDWRPGTFDWRADPRVAAAIGLGISSADDFVRGERGEEHLREALRDDPDDPWSTQAVSRRGAAGFHDLPGLAVREAGGRQQEVPGRAPTAGPTDLAGLGRLIPDDDHGRPQVRVESVRGTDGVQRWVVAVAGTTTFDPDEHGQVFDMRSNLQGVGQESMDAEVATEQALRDAGVRPTDPVLVVGHSQGALVATGLARSGRFDVRGVVTLGGPTRAVPVPGDVPVLAVEHSDDFIPTLGGAAPAGPPPANVVRVTRTVYDDAPPPIVGHVAMDPAHQPSEYVKTLAEADRSSDPRLVEFRADVHPFLTGAPATEDLFRADRVAVSDAPPAAQTAAAAAGPRPSR